MRIKELEKYLVVHHRRESLSAEQDSAFGLFGGAGGTAAAPARSIKRHRVKKPPHQSNTLNVGIWDLGARVGFLPEVINKLNAAQSGVHPMSETTS